MPDNADLRTSRDGFLLLPACRIACGALQMFCRGAGAWSKGPSPALRLGSCAASFCVFRKKHAKIFRHDVSPAPALKMVMGGALRSTREACPTGIRSGICRECRQKAFAVRAAAATMFFRLNGAGRDSVQVLILSGSSREYLCCI